MKAIETTGRIEKPGIVKLDKPTILHSRQKVRIIILYNEDDDINEELWLKAHSSNPSFSFLNDKEEDIYSVTDGKPFKK
jgi:hypothetical protein